MTILVTGGAGYIGSHTVIELQKNGFDVVIVDNFCNSSPSVLKRIELITGKEIKCYDIDLLDFNSLQKVFVTNNINSVIHFASLKSVSESLIKPTEYYHNNLSGCLNVLKIMKEHNVNNFIFSSSATVYGSNSNNPVSESSSVGTATNPYGKSKIFLEQILSDCCKSNPNLNVTCLRYFNPVGAHSSGLIGESPNGVPANLVPYLTQVALGKLPVLHIYGNDYDTKDGTGVRDFIHVTDLANGHIAALKKINGHNGFKVYNLGTGRGYSVLEVVRCFEAITGKSIPIEFSPRREGDIAESWANVSAANYELEWFAKKTLTDMLRDAWKWQTLNPNGL
ncbi:UDP-glucose 4-epimerase GalE [Shigella boydii]|uniref:UDP-glucose 4-epimerase GalE n=1 Tax=Shigella boydii TaxID=621 RepID=UPI00026754FB|nr:UDP-glucose 4-epimerase GalE [Shigella boydii]EIQ32791.1 UDP-glucose 4-epimerase [Shigella boydii 965-58]